mmetsp:Transcript_21407/g.59421  ORF Transcript_21407/g.59421 Transcript_21407/m.59421 type:complete len:120 (+) Transcript_21407:152-511(+)
MMPPGPPPPEDQSKSKELFNINNHRNNLQVVYFCRVYAAIVGGVFTGIIGVTGFFGILHLVLWQGVFTGLLVLKSQTASKDKRYFTSMRELLLDQAFNSTTLLTFILFWTFAYSLVYVF